MGWKSMSCTATRSRCPRCWRDADVLVSRGPIDLEAKFEANLLNTAVFLLGLSQQVSTFAINFQVNRDHVNFSNTY
jgi:hypothetical protein